jgi:hypothetical protein
MPTAKTVQPTANPLATKITPILKFYMDDGTIIERELKSVPQDGVDSTFTWVATQTKPNPLDPSGPPWNKWQNSPNDTQIDIACNFANDLILLQIKQIVSVAPPPSVVAASEAVTAAQAVYQVELDKACGLIDPPARLSL